MEEPLDYSFLIGATGVVILFVNHSVIESVIYKVIHFLNGKHYIILEICYVIHTFKGTKLVVTMELLDLKSDPDPSGHTSKI